MNFKHFIKTLLLFTAMIALGLLGVFLVSYFEKGGESTNEVNIVPVAK